MLGAEPALRSDMGSAFLGLWRSSREERRVADRATDVLGELGICARRPPIPERTALRRAEAGRAGRALDGRATIAAAGRAGERAVRERHGRAGLEDPGPDRSHGGAPRGAPHGPRHVGLRPPRRAELRTRSSLTAHRTRSAPIPRWRSCISEPRLATTVRPTTRRRTMLEVRGTQRLLRGGASPPLGLVRCRTRSDHRSPGRQRRRQDHSLAHDLGPGEAAGGLGALRRASRAGPQGREHRAHGGGSRARGSRRDRGIDGGGEPASGHPLVPSPSRAAGGHRRDPRPVPTVADLPATPGIDPLRRGAPDAGSWARPISMAPSSPARRAESGLGPDGHRPPDGPPARRRPRATDIAVVLVEQNARSALSVSHHDGDPQPRPGRRLRRRATVADDDDLRHHYLGF